MQNDNEYYSMVLAFTIAGVVLAWLMVNSLYGASCTIKNNYQPIVVHFYEHN
jgi:hypothetical protein